MATETAPPLNEAANTAINKLLADAGVNATVDVTVKVDPIYDGSPKPEPKELLSVVVHSPDANTQPLATANAVNAVLSKIPALDQLVQFETDGEHASIMKERLEKPTRCFYAGY